MPKKMSFVSPSLSPRASVGGQRLDRSATNMGAGEARLRSSAAGGRRGA
jgi:hypothetical protein